MTPKEKAIELFDKMFEPNNHYMNKNIEIDKIIAKECALIAVDELIEFTYNYTDYNEKSTKEYWQEVKHEIEKL